MASWHAPGLRLAAPCAAPWAARRHQECTVRQRAHFAAASQPTEVLQGASVWPSPLWPARTLFVTSAGACCYRGKRHRRQRHSLRRARQLCRAAATPGTVELEDDSLPPYCGLVLSEGAEVIVMGVAHRDGGVSARAARRVISEYDPDACFLELDAQRFSRLVADRRGLPWPYSPPGGATLGPLTSALGAVMKVGLQAQQAVSGSSGLGQDEAGLESDEFSEAFGEAERCGALVIPGDALFSSTFVRFASAVRTGWADPLGQLKAGLDVSFNAWGGIVERPRCGGEAVRGLGIALPMALASEGAGRAAPIALWAAVGAACIPIVYLTPLPNNADDFDPTQYLLDLVGLQSTNNPSEDFFLALATDFVPKVFIILFLASTFAISFLQERDTIMADQLSRTVSVVEGLQSSLIVAKRPLLWCRWEQRSWIASAPSPSADGQQTVPARWRSLSLSRPPPALAAGGKGRLAAVALPCNPLPSGCPEPRVFDAVDASTPVGDAWLPLLLLESPLDEGELRELTLIEPCLVNLVDAMVARGPRGRGLTFGVAHALHRAERPTHLTAPEPAGQTPQPPLAIEVDAILSGSGRVAESVDFEEARGADGLSSWRVTLRGAAQLLHLPSCDVSSDGLGALWAAPRASDASPSSSPWSSASASSSTPPAPRRRARCVAVVGLLHVNGVVRRLQSLLDKPSGGAQM